MAEVPLTPLKVPVIVASPSALAVTRPPAFTVATLAADVTHDASVVTSRVLPSLYVAVAVNWTVPPTINVRVEGAIATDVTVATA